MHKTIKHAFSMFYTLIKHGFLTNQSAQGSIYIITSNKTFELKLTFTLWLSLEDMPVNWINERAELVDELHVYDCTVVFNLTVTAHACCTK